MNNWFENFLFGEPAWAVLLILLPLLALVRKKRGNGIRPAIRFPTISQLPNTFSRKTKKWIWLPSLLRTLALICMIAALCRPQLDKSTRTVFSSGVDVVLAVDLSASMLALDMSETRSQEVTRLDVVKEVLKDFIDKRKHDRIGLVAFSVAPYLVSALTLDKEHLHKNLERLRVGLTHETGTNLGSALAEGINRLRPLQSKSKILILLTDGKDEPTPPHSPLIFAHGAKEDGIKIYTIAIGTNTQTRTYLFDPSTRDLLRAQNGLPIVRMAQYPVDEEILSNIAKTTGGAFFQARDESSLRLIYEEIDRLEKTDVEMQVNALFDDLYLWPLGAAILLLILEFILSRTIYLRIP